MSKRTRNDKIEVRVSEEEKNTIQLAAKMRDMSMSDFVRHMALEMARAISTNKSPKETYHALIMATGKIAPEVTVYAATADMADYVPMTEKGGSETET